jgi:hypothetical protein
MGEHGHQDPPGDEDQPEVNQTVGQHGRQRRRAMQPGGAILMFEPSGTSSTGDGHEGEIPAHVDSTSGRDI